MLPYWIEIHPAASHGLKCLPTRYSENMRGVGRSFSYTADDVDIISGDELIHPKNRSYPARSSTGGGVGKVILPTMRWQM
jgi:hypothetical protein